MESEYERRRRENIESNQRVLAELGLDSGTTQLSKSSQERRPRERDAPLYTKSRTSLRSAGVDVDAPPEVVAAAVAEASTSALAGSTITSERAPIKPMGKPMALTEEQRSQLVSASGWIARMREFLASLVSQSNLEMTMKRVEELASGVGVYLKGWCAKPGCAAVAGGWRVGTWWQWDRLGSGACSGI